jgi:hypothetical protein
VKSLFLAGITLLLSSPVLGQSVEELQRRLADKEAENQQLRQRVEILEREVTPRRIGQTRPAPVAAVAGADDAEDSNRALERALVRERGLLLSSGVYEIEPNFIYSHISNDSAAFRRDSFGPGLTLRAGLPWRSQLELALPYVFEQRRSGIVSTNASGFGDWSIGVSHQLLSERPFVPGLIGAITYQAATGRNTVFESATPVALGSGFDSVQGVLTAVKRVDPLVFFGSYAFTHNFASNKNGIEVAPGNSNGLRFGTILATSPGTSLRAAFNLTLYDKTKFGGIERPGSDDPSGLLEFGGSAVLTESTALDVLVGAGVTHNAPKYRITVALPIRF